MGLSGKGLGQANVVISVTVLGHRGASQKCGLERKATLVFLLLKTKCMACYERCHKEIMLGYLAISISRIFLNSKIFIEHLLCSSL